MAKVIRINVDLDEKQYNDIHNLMNLTLQSEEGITIYRVHKGNSKQSFYRNLLDIAVQQLYKKFLEERKKIEDESQDSHRK